MVVVIQYIPRYVGILYNIRQSIMIFIGALVTHSDIDYIERQISLNVEKIIDCFAKNKRCKHFEL